MGEIVTTMTQRGQVTVPAEVRRLLGLKPKDKVAFEVGEDGRVIIRRPKFTLETAFGSVKPINRPEDFEQIVRDVREERVERQIRILKDE
jgi:AbrB family looped-hinge helix DNA binding protein